MLVAENEKKTRFPTGSFTPFTFGLIDYPFIKSKECTYMYNFCFIFSLLKYIKVPVAMHACRYCTTVVDVSSWSSGANNIKFQDEKVDPL